MVKSVPFIIFRIKEADIIGMLRRGNIAMPRAAELLKTSPANLIGLIEQVYFSLTFYSILKISF